MPVKVPRDGAVIPSQCNIKRLHAALCARCDIRLMFATSTPDAHEKNNGATMWKEDQSGI